MGLFLEAITRSQDKAVELLGILYGDVLDDCLWAEKIIQSKNLQLAEIEAKGVSHCP